MKQVTKLIHLGYFNDTIDLNKMSNREPYYIVDYFENGYGKFYKADNEESIFNTLMDIDANPDNCVFSEDNKYLIVFSFEKGKTFDESKGDTDEFIDLYRVVTFNEGGKYETSGIATEMCSNCEEEFNTPAKLGVYRCPCCGRWQVNCSMCFALSDNVKCCEKCPLQYEADMRNKEEDMKDGFL